MLRHIFFIIVLLLISSCIEEYQLDTNENPRLLVVNGQITNRPGPYQVELKYANEFGKNSDFSQPINNAEVYLEDSEGNLEQMTAIGLGKYVTEADGIQGKIGNSYWLNITLSDGSSYRSFPEKLQTVPMIDSMYYRTEKVIRYDPANRPFTSIQFPVYVKVSDPDETANFYYWDWDALEQVFTNVPPPPPIDSEDTIVTTCYLLPSFKINNSIVIASDQFNNGNDIEQLIYNLPYDRSSQFLITVYQHSLSEKAYEYLRRARQESRRTGSIFDPAPVNVKGNIESIEDPDEIVLGYFLASAISWSRLLVNRDGIKETPNNARLEGDCRYLYPNSYAEKPEGFK